MDAICRIGSRYGEGKPGPPWRQSSGLLPDLRSPKIVYHVMHRFPASGTWNSTSASITEGSPAIFEELKGLSKEWEGLVRREVYRMTA